MNLTEYVNPFLGVDPPGHCLPGPCLPLGIVRLGPDVAFPQPTNGYTSGAPIIRFSHTHVAGTGGCSRYGNVGISPFTGEPEKIIMSPYLMARTSREAPQDNSGEHAELAYYRVELLPSQIIAELTCTRHVGIHRYRYPQGKQAWILLDAGAVIEGNKSCGKLVFGGEFWDYPQRSIGGELKIESGHEVVGHCELQGGWGHDQPYSVYFCLRTSQKIRNVELASCNGLKGGGIGSSVSGADGRAALGFGNNEKLELRVGISFVSIENARKYIIDETDGLEFTDIRNAAVEEWEKCLSGIKVSGGSEDERRIFYSLFYRLMTMPTDLGIDQENPRWKSGVRHFWDFYCLWDSIRNANSLIGLFAPELHRDMINCLLDIGEHTGWLPDAWIAGHHAYQQSGCFCDVLLREAMAKKLPGVDYHRALKLLTQNAETPTPDPHRKGRYPEWEQFAYLPEGVPNCLSRSIEYSYLDWCIGKMAETMGDRNVAEKYLQNSQNLWKLWDDKQKSFIPRNKDGEQVAGFDPEKMRSDCWNDPFVYEALGRSWNLCVFHDVYSLIERFGGAKAFISHLDEHFEKGWFNVKETKMHTPFLYIYAGRPDRTAERIRESMLNSFSNTRKGLGDNEDMGCQSTYYICGAIGLYPVMGQALWLLAPPLFDDIKIRLGESGKHLLIKVNRKGGGKYICGALLDGRPIDRAWLRHAEIADGAELTLELADKPGNWGSRELPPIE